MKTRCAWRALPLALVLGWSGCGGENVASDGETGSDGGTDTGTGSMSGAEGVSASGGDGDPGDGDPTAGDGDPGDGDPGDGDPGDGDPGDGDPTAGDGDPTAGDGDPGDGDGDPDPCGNGVLDQGEQCDDGNMMSDDGCSDVCLPELYWVCVDDSCEPIRILYAPAADDDAGLRNAIAAVTGGPVDYHDATNSTPLLMDVQADYDCVITHTGGRYFNRFEMSDLLVEYVDNGGVAVLGLGVGSVSAFGLGNLEIMSDLYSPVDTAGGNTVAAVNYAGDGATALHTDVAAYGLGSYDDDVVLQGMGASDGTYDNAAITAAYRPDYAVVYLNGTGHAQFNPSGDWPTLMANACAVAYVQ